MVIHLVKYRKRRESSNGRKSMYVTKLEILALDSNIGIFLIPVPEKNPYSIFLRKILFLL